jgi:hypothetical protein
MVLVRRSDEHQTNRKTATRGSLRSSALLSGPTGARPGTPRGGCSRVRDLSPSFGPCSPGRCSMSSMSQSRRCRSPRPCISSRCSTSWVRPAHKSCVRHIRQFSLPAPGADVVEAGPHGLRRVEWANLELVDHWRRYLDNPDDYLRHITQPVTAPAADSSTTV